MKLRNTAIITAAAALLLACPAFASTGDPVADGWAYGSNALENGTYVRGDGNFGFDIYSTSLTLGAGSNLLDANWQVGDTVLGIGGVINAISNPAQLGWPSITGPTVNDNLTQSVRIVTKFGTSPTAWGASSNAPSAGNGSGSFSGGAGGDGSLLLATYSPASNNGLHLHPSPDYGLLPSILGPNLVHEIPLLQRYDAGVVTTLASTAGKLIYTLDGNDVLATWEVFVNVSLLEGYGIVPELGDRGLQTLQRSTGVYTDGLVEVVPEPATLALLTLGSVALLRRR